MFRLNSYTSDNQSFVHFLGTRTPRWSVGIKNNRSLPQTLKSIVNELCSRIQNRSRHVSSVFPAHPIILDHSEPGVALIEAEAAAKLPTDRGSKSGWVYDAVRSDTSVTIPHPPDQLITQSRVRSNLLTATISRGRRTSLLFGKYCNSICSKFTCK